MKPSIILEPKIMPYTAWLWQRLTAETDRFLNPSRTGRFCTRYLQFLAQSRNWLSALIRPAMQSGYLAPTISQRLKYIDWLHIYAKDHSRIPGWMTSIVDDYVDLKKEQLDNLSSVSQWIRSDTTSLYDVWSRP
ncbi:hypothetical protein B0H14DRAFT_2592366 [Mycena olivaceomarginata]|nr:hypothetical protein B0H14DRAFT_2592366 [Mycena olivaceomarginata]